MFSHLCRCCLSEFKSSSDIVPLFERHKNIWYHRLVTATFRLSVTKADNLGTNICKGCAIEILKSYKFRLKYVESERKLLQMLAQEQDPGRCENMFNVEVTIDESASTLQTNSHSQTTDLRWKCNLCSASFATRSQYSEHRRSHSKKVASQMVIKKKSSPTNKNEKQNRWKCGYCPAEFGTDKLKLKHERDEHSDNISFHEPTVLIAADDSSIISSIKQEVDIDTDHQADDFITSIKTEVTTDNDQNEFRYIDHEPEVDLALYLIEKHSQINSLDPLDTNNFNGSLLEPQATSSPVTENYINRISKWKCRICAASFRTRGLLRVHNQIHMGMKRPKLVVPKEEKVKVSKAQNASRVIVPTDELNVPKWQCKTCLLIFDTRELLRTHRRAFTGRNEKTGVKQMLCNIEGAVDHVESKETKIFYSLT